MYGYLCVCACVRVCFYVSVCVCVSVCILNLLQKLLLIYICVKFCDVGYHPRDPRVHKNLLLLNV